MTTRTAPARQWTAESVREHVAATPNMDWASEGDDVYVSRYVRDVNEFGLTLRLEAPRTPREGFDVTLMPILDVDLTDVASSTQTEGVCLDIIEHYLDSDELFDRDGWFGNAIPVLIRRPDSTCTVRDGNHRVIAAILRGDATITAHVVG